MRKKENAIKAPKIIESHAKTGEVKTRSQKELISIKSPKYGAMTKTAFTGSGSCVRIKIIPMRKNSMERPKTCTCWW